MRNWNPGLRLALRTTLAGLVTFALGHVLKLPQAYWAVLTAVIVMQASVATSLKAVVDRMLGTVAGAVWGVIVTLLIPHHGPVALGAALAVALAPLALMAALRPSYRVAPITAVIVLLSTTGVQLGPVHYALDRVVEIAVGCVVGLAVSVLVVPDRAQGLLADAAAEVILSLRALADLLLAELARPTDATAVGATHARLNQTLTRVEALVDEVKRERAHRLSDAPDAEPFARTLRRLRHDFTAISRAVAEPLPPLTLHHLADATGELRRALTDYLTDAATAVRERRPAPAPVAVDHALQGFRAAVDRLRQSETLRQLSIDELERVLSLAFALQQLAIHLADLAERIAEHATSRPATVGSSATSTSLTQGERTS
jgi:uncharacterized membrane protein YccC